MTKAIDIKEKLTSITAYWTPYIAARVNDHYVKLARLNGEFVWHSHESEDELFLVVRGELFLDFRDKTVVVGAGQMYVVPRGVEHKPRTGPQGADVVLFEPVTTRHTGSTISDRTVDKLDWI
ncbi:MAG: cupin domain-containing protein [Saprospiraceae bacterium]|nr:cupin domain-containing protein [Saprospiraceae bacterium]